MKGKWTIRFAVLFFILTSWVGLFVLSFKPKGVANILKMVTKPVIRSFYSPAVLVLCDFESQSDLNDWYRNYAGLDIFWGHATSGEASGKVQFEGSKKTKERFPGFMLENYVIGPKGEKNWSRYNFFKVDFYNPIPKDIALFIKIKDTRARAFQEIFIIEGGKEIGFSLDLIEIADSLDLKNIVYVNFFLADLKEDVTLFVDNIRLEKGSAAPARMLEKPFITFVGLDAPSRATLDETVSVSCSFKTSQSINRNYMVFIHLFPLSGKEEKFSRRLGYIRADVWPAIPTTQWQVNETYQIGPVGVYIPYNNPVGEYGIQIGLYNPAQRGSSKPRFEWPNRGAVDFSGSYPKLRYTNNDIGKDYIVGKMVVTK